MNRIIIADLARIWAEETEIARMVSALDSEHEDVLESASETRNIADRTYHLIDAASQRMPPLPVTAMYTTATDPVDVCARIASQATRYISRLKTDIPDEVYVLYDKNAVNLIDVLARLRHAYKFHVL